MIIENKHLLPEPWYEYPVLQEGEFEKIELLEKKCILGSTIKVGIQDGVWTLGYDFLGRGCNPGRKWGEFESRENAIEYFILENLPRLEEIKKDPKKSPYYVKMQEINEMYDKMKQLLIDCRQLKLF